MPSQIGLPPGINGIFRSFIGFLVLESGQINTILVAPIIRSAYRISHTMEVMCEIVPPCRWRSGPELRNRARAICCRSSKATKEMTVATQLEVAKHRLFDEKTLHAANVKLFPGSNREATPEQMAEQVNKAIAQIEVGDYEEVKLEG